MGVQKADVEMVLVGDWSPAAALDSVMLAGKNCWLCAIQDLARMAEGWGTRVGDESLSWVGGGTQRGRVRTVWVVAPSTTTLDEARVSGFNSR